MRKRLWGAVIMVSVAAVPAVAGQQTRAKTDHLHATMVTLFETGRQAVSPCDRLLGGEAGAYDHCVLEQEWRANSRAFVDGLNYEVATRAEGAARSAKAKELDDRIMSAFHGSRREFCDFYHVDCAALSAALSAALKEQLRSDP
jgi:hypothetical protein